MKKSIADILEHKLNKLSNLRGRAGHIPTKIPYDVKPESQATAKHNWHRLNFDPNTMKLPKFLEELNQRTKKAVDENAKSILDSWLYANLPPNIKRTVNVARLENGTYEEIVEHLEKKWNSTHWRSQWTYQLQQWRQRQPVTVTCCPIALTPTIMSNVLIVKQ